MEIVCLDLEGVLVPDDLDSHWSEATGTLRS